MMDEKNQEDAEGTGREYGAGGETAMHNGWTEEGRQGALSGNRSSLWKYIVIIIAALLVAVPGGYYGYRYMEESDPNYYIKHQKTGEGYFKAGQYEQAIQEFQKSSKVKPDSLASSYGLAMSYMRAQDYEKAVESFEKALKIAPERVDVMYSLGVAYQKMGRLEKALQVYYEVGRLDPRSYQVYNNAGTIYADMANFDKAVQAFEASIRRNPEYYPAYFNLAKVYESQGKRDLALKQYRIVRDRTRKKPQTENFAKLAEQRIAALSTPMKANK